MSEATWECEAYMKVECAEFNLEDKVASDEHDNVTPRPKRVQQ
ncbi:hypothetical protein CCACVL1_07136 [Corchorus capsularis]|uniref:Uncharacterized protein n=1 Tax=Corchorus capsularis TaxID=210143 RepID=A0A1R3J962_COCAP|nr:hypothetical protein CCACVL1_07136 [Corchorus capsularis]